MRIQSASLIAIGWLAVAPPLIAQLRYAIADELAGGPGTPPVVVLRDNTAGVEAAIAPSEGGELASYRVKIRGEWTEFLFHARDYSPGAGFKGKGPLLWPAVGAQFPVGTVPAVSCGPGTYQQAGKSYPMPCHGFAKSLPWRESKRSADAKGARVTVQLRDSGETLPSYPYAFRVDATYELAGGRLTIDYVVASGASNKSEMIFAIGNHIAFKLPFVKGSEPDKMTFETNSTTQLLRNPQGTLSGESKSRTFHPAERLGDFDSRVALPLAGYGRSQPFAKLVDPQGVSLLLTQQASTAASEPIVRFNLYGGPQVGYLCPEPFFGVQNSLNTGQGLVRLRPGKDWKWRLELRVDDTGEPAHSR